jgi:hypothetical protein
MFAKIDTSGDGELSLAEVFTSFRWESLRALLGFQWVHVAPAEPLGNAV